MLDALEREPGLVVAQRYARAGIPVFPCNPLNKRPMVENGFKDATTDPLKIRGWWAKWPQAMVGAPMGARSGLWALDVDNDPTKGKYGLQSLADIGHPIEELIDGPHARSASGGYHFFFRFDPERPITNARGALPKWVDVRGEGGYVILAGSVNAEGALYRWVNSTDDVPVDEAPAWLMDLLLQRGEGLDFNKAAPQPKSPVQRVADAQPGTWHENTRDYIARAVREGLSDDMVASLAPMFQRPGYSLEQTERELLTHARTARAKWGYQPKNLEADAEALKADVFKLFTIAELATLKPPEWRIDGIFPCHGSSTLYGAYETYKTFIALDMLLSLAVGRAWQGREVKPCSIVYVAGEGQHGLAQRVLGWCAAKNGGALPDNFLLLPEAVAIPSPNNLDKLLRTLDTLPEAPGVVALDTITRMSAGGSLNDEKDMQQYVLGMDRLRRHTSGHVMNVGHSGKDKEKGLLGSIVLPAAMETIMCAERSKDRLTLINSNPKGKQKDGPNFEDIKLRTQQVHFDQGGHEASTLVIMTDDEPVSGGDLNADTKPSERSPGRPQGSNQQAIMAALRKAKGEPLGLTRLMTMTGKSNDAVFHAVRALAAKGIIQELEGEGAKRWVLQ